MEDKPMNIGNESESLLMFMYCLVCKGQPMEWQPDGQPFKLQEQTTENVGWEQTAVCPRCGKHAYTRTVLAIYFKDDEVEVPEQGDMQDRTARKG